MKHVVESDTRLVCYIVGWMSGFGMCVKPVSLTSLAPQGEGESGRPSRGSTSTTTATTYTSSETYPRTDTITEPDRETAREAYTAPTEKT